MPRSEHRRWLCTQCGANQAPPKFPAIREKNREFCKFVADSEFFAPIQRANPEAWSKIPCATEQGNNSREQGWLRQDQGILKRYRFNQGDAPTQLVILRFPC